MDELTRFFTSWRTIAARDREIVDAVVVPEHAEPSPELAAALDGWEGAFYWTRERGAAHLILIRATAPAPRERWLLHVSLFAITFWTVSMGGAILSGTFLRPGFLFTLEYRDAARQATELTRELLSRGVGLDFAFGLMAILLVHELGHYLMARRYCINASPPYFLPAMPSVNFIGTFGAFIRLRSPIADRRQLMDVGAAGPWAGFVVALVVLVVGLTRSAVLADGAPAPGGFHQVVMLASGPSRVARLYLGDSLVMDALRRLMVGDAVIQLHPLAVAGWLGVFVTTLNLLPLGQLDGGHVLFALAGRRQGAVSAVALVGLVVLGFVVGRNTTPLMAWFWWIWALIILAVGRGRVAHPEVLDRHRPLTPGRKVLGWATLLLFVATFSPTPFFIHY